MGYIYKAYNMGMKKHSRLFILENAVQRELNVMSDALILT